MFSGDVCLMLSLIGKGLSNRVNILGKNMGSVVGMPAVEDVIEG